MPVPKEPWLSKVRRRQRKILDFAVRRYAASELESRAEEFVRIFAGDLVPGSRILDIGGGWGFYHSPLSSRGHRHWVLDVLRPGLQKCPAVLYGGERFPFPDKSFDVSLLVTVLHHIPDHEAVIREAMRVTRGVIVVVEDVYRHALGRAWTVLRDQILNLEFFGHPKNFRTAGQWIELFERHGAVKVRELPVRTKLLGLDISNSVMVFRVPRPAGAASEVSKEPAQQAGDQVWRIDLGDLGQASASPEGEAGLRASGVLPEDLECCRDHFPGFPVLPGVLALEIQNRLAQFFLTRDTGRVMDYPVREIRSVKFSNFLKPGDAWEFQGSAKTAADGKKVWKGRLFSGGRAAVSSELVFEAPSRSGEA